MARAAVSTVPWPDIMTMGKSGRHLISSESRSRPVSSLEARYQQNQRWVLVQRVKRLHGIGGLASDSLVFHDTGDQGTNIGFVIDNGVAETCGLIVFPSPGVAPTLAFVVSSVFGVEAGRGVRIESKPIKAPPPANRQAPSDHRGLP